MLRLTSSRFSRLGLQWQLCVEVDRCNNTIGAFLRQARGPAFEGLLAFTLELRVGGASVVFKPYQNNRCSFMGAGHGWGQLRMARLDQVLM